MPAAIAHRIFADLYLSSCPYPDLARIGSEGPDPFMAYGMTSPMSFRFRKGIMP